MFAFKIEFHNSKPFCSVRDPFPNRCQLVCPDVWLRLHEAQVAKPGDGFAFVPIKSSQWI
jgi:hypothetical protein